MTRKGKWLGLTAAAGLVGLVGCGANGSSGNAKNPIGDAAIGSVDVVARAGTFQRPLDAAPSPDGSVIYFVATGPSGPAVYRAPAAGGAESAVAEGGALAQPTGVAVATDGSRVYVADQAARPPGAAAGPGAILTAKAADTGQAPSVLPGTGGRAPRGLDVVNQGDSDVIYFTGSDPANGKPGLFQVSTAGGTVTTIAEGAPFTAPDTVIVSAQGVAYVTDQGPGAGQGQIFRVSGGTVTSVLTGQHLGNPAGVTLIRGDAILLVSSIDAATSSDQVLFLDLATGRTAAASKVIGANKNSSGGLHRAHSSAMLAWADVRGTVYRVRVPVVG